MAPKNQFYYIVIINTTLLQFIHINVSAATFSQNVKNILRRHDFIKAGAAVKNAFHLNTLIQDKNSFRQKTFLKFRDDPFGLGIDIDEDLGYKNEAMESLGLCISGRMNIDDLLQSALDSLKKPKEIVEVDASTRIVKSDLFFADCVLEDEESDANAKNTIVDDKEIEDQSSLETEQERKSRIAAREIEIQKKLLQKKVKRILAEQEKNAIALAEMKRIEEAKKLQDAAREEERRRMENMKQEMERIAAEREKERTKELKRLKLITKSAEKDKKVISDAEKEIKEILAAAKKEDKLITEAAREIKDRLASTVSPDDTKLDRERRIAAQKREFEQFFPLKQKKKTKPQNMEKTISNETVADKNTVDEKPSVSNVPLKPINTTSIEKKIVNSSKTDGSNESLPKQQDKVSFFKPKRVKTSSGPMQIKKDNSEMGDKQAVSKNTAPSPIQSPKRISQVEKKSADKLLEKVTAMEKDMEKEIEAFISRASKAISSEFSRVVSEQLLNFSKTENDQTKVVKKLLMFAKTDEKKKDTVISRDAKVRASSEVSKEGDRKSSDDARFDPKNKNLQLKAEEETIQRQIEAMKQKKKVKEEELFARTKVLEAKRKRQEEQQKAIANAIAREEANAIANAKKEAEKEALQIAKRRAIELEAAEQTRKQARDAEEKLRSRPSLTLQKTTNFQMDSHKDASENVLTNRETDSRIRYAYDNWCKEYGKISDESRYLIFSTNFLDMEEKSKKFGTPFYLNEYADCTQEEYLSSLRVADSEIDSRFHEDIEQIPEVVENIDVTSTSLTDNETVDADQEDIKTQKKDTQSIQNFVLEDLEAEEVNKTESTLGDIDLAKDKQNTFVIPSDPTMHIDTLTELSKIDHVRKKHVVLSKSNLFSSITRSELQLGKINLHRISTLSASIENGVSLRQHEILCQAKKRATVASLTVLAHLVTCTHKNTLYIKELNKAYEIKKDLLVAKYINSNVRSNRKLAYLLSLGLLDVHRETDFTPEQETLTRSFKAISSSMALLILLSVFEAGACLKIGERLALYSILANNRLPNISSHKKRSGPADESILFSSRSRENEKLEKLIDEYILD